MSTGLIYKHRYNNIGPRLHMQSESINIELQLKYEDLTVFEYPKSCTSCPCGFTSCGDCGRNVPFAPEDSHNRPVTCKLKLADMSFVLNQISERINQYEKCKE